jgi:hypothetical protein
MSTTVVNINTPTIIRDIISTSNISNINTIDKIIESSGTIVTEKEIISKIIVEGLIGPAGPAGPAGDEEVMYSKRVDFITDSLLYRGEAVPGSAESAAVWRIRRITLGIDNDVEEVWADGTDSFTKIWNNRAGYNYT